jgi:DNA-binding SARP family transcriptional activator
VASRNARLRRVLDVAAAVFAALLAFTAVPAVLVFVVGDPLSRGLGHAWRPLPRDALCVLAVAAWVAWVACCVQLARAVVVHVRTGDLTALRGGSVMDRVAARIAVGVFALTTVGAPLALSSVAGATATAPAVGAGISTVERTTVSLAQAGHSVQRGETLWGIADRHLGDGADWTAIAALNLGRDMGGGTRFVDPDQLRPGWHLHLPFVAGPQAHAAWRDGRSHPRTSHPGERLPELLALGMGSLAAAALGRRARSRRRIDPFSGDLILGRTASEGATDTAALLYRFEDVPALHAFEAANSLLGRSQVDERTTPAVRAVCVSPDGVTFWLREPGADVPDGFRALRDGTAWHVDHATLRDQEPFSPHVPVVLPIGDDDEGTWLVALWPGDVLPILGEAAPSLVRAARAAAGAWAWSDVITTTDDPEDPALRPPPGADPTVAGHRLFIGDPRSLPAEVARQTAIVTTAPVAASDLTVLVDRQGATLHPMGRVVRPHLQSVETSQRLQELIAPTDQREVEPPSLTAVRAPAARARAGITASTPGIIEVRLLTITPRLDGLHEDLPPNRARRAVELVAYLALHHPDVITGDRLRTRVLGSSDADAASKTLFNTAYAARRAMGVDERGEPLFPAGSRSGLYQLSSRVTVDVHRAMALAEEARAQADPGLAVTQFHAALDLVEGEPLANALSGYSWWEAEGHGGRIAAVLVDAACSMAALACDAGRFELARWGLEQARLVEPYSEALSRAAMQVAAAEGDADRLRLEWRECQRRVDALDPGSSPSVRTESLYGELRRRVLVGSGSEPQRPRYAPAASD